MTEAEAYIAGWNAIMRGGDARGGLRFADEHATGNYEKVAYAWTAGALDAFEAEDGEEPDPAAAGF